MLDRPLLFVVCSICNRCAQWRRQDLLRAGAKMEIMSWGTHGGAWCSSCSITNSFVTNAVLIKRRCELLRSASANLADYTLYLDSWLSDLLQSELKMKLSKVEGRRGHVPQCSIAGDATGCATNVQTMIMTMIGALVTERRKPLPTATTNRHICSYC